MLASGTLLRAAKDGTIDPEQWAHDLNGILARLDRIVHDEFPLPVTHARPVTPHRNPANSSTLLPHITPDSSSSYLNDKENAPPSSPPQPSSNTTVSHTPTHHSSEDMIDPEGTLPLQLLVVVTNIKTALSSQFVSGAPHTIQRLAELLLYPRKQYRFLPSYLNALDRVVSVSSPADMFPLPTIDVQSSASFMGGGVVSAPINNIGSDESLGGALLTPIPWLREHQVDAHPIHPEKVNGVGHELVSDNGVVPQQSMEENMRDEGAVTQGELLRQEQETSAPPFAVGSVLNTQHTLVSTSPHGIAARNHADVEIKDDNNQAHARGPERIGLADTGLQGHALGVGQVLDMAAAAGRSGPAPGLSQNGQGHRSSQVLAQLAQTETMDSDGDTIIADVDGTSDDELQRSGGSDENIVSDAMDTTAS